MKKLFILLLCAVTYNPASAQFIATVQMDEHVEGICNDKEVYALFPGFTGQIEAKSTIDKKEIEEMLNKIPFLKENPTFKGSGMIGFYVSCEGKMIGCEMDNKTKSKELDAQIVAVFNELLIDTWKPGTLNGKEVDTRLLYSFDIKKGKLTLN